MIEQNRQSMYKVARSYFQNEEDIADALQDTIEACYRSIPHLANPEYFRTWLIRITINKCNDIIRKNRREHPVEEFPAQGEMCMELKNCEFEELMRSLDENTVRSFFSITEKVSKSARSHSFSTWKKTR